MTSDGKLSVGQIWKPPPTGIWNALIDVALWWLRGGASNNLPTFADSSTDTVTLKNSSGSGLAQGRVLEIGAKLLTTIDRNSLWFDGSTPAPDGTKGIAVALRQVPNGEIARKAFQVSGTCWAKVNIVHEQQRYADVDSASTLLQSKWHGRAEILAKESTGTGEKTCLVRLGEMFRGPILCKATSGITAGSSASCTVYVASIVTSPSSTITVHLKDLDGGNNLASDKFLWAWWKPDDQRYETGNAEC